MDSTGIAQGTHTGYADEGVMMDRRGVKIRMRKVSFRGILKQEGVQIYICMVKRRQQNLKQRVEAVE